MRLIKFILSEDSSMDVMNKAEDLAELLKKAYKVDYRTIKNAWKESGENYPRFYELLLKIKKAIDERPQEKSADGDDIASLGHDELSSSQEVPEKEEPLRDESIVDVLGYLAKLWQSKDKVRVVAARLGIDPDLYELAGLGRIPSNPSDEDVWNTMDMSEKGKLPFYDSAWQPFYMKSMEELKNLPDEVKDEIKTMVQQGAESKREVTYPVDSNKPYDDTGRTFEEVELVDDVVLESNGSINIISKGTKIRILK